LTHIFEGLALKQTSKQQVALFPQAKLFINVNVFAAWQQATSLQFDKRCRNQQELGCQLKIERLKLGDLGKILIHNDRQVDLVDVNLLFQNEVQQQVEGSLKYWGGNVDSHRIEANRQSGLGAGKTAKTADQSRPNKPQ
jgi:hypothetical protein